MAAVLCGSRFSDILRLTILIRGFNLRRTHVTFRDGVLTTTVSQIQRRRTAHIFALPSILRRLAMRFDNVAAIPHPPQPAMQTRYLFSI